MEVAHVGHREGPRVLLDVEAVAPTTRRGHPGTVYRYLDGSPFVVAVEPAEMVAPDADLFLDHRARCPAR